MQFSSPVREVPSLDDDLHRLRPNGYQSAEVSGEDGGNSVVGTLEPLPALSHAQVPAALVKAGGTLSRPTSALSYSPGMSDPKAAKARRRVQIDVGSDDEDGGKDRDTKVTTPISLCLPGRSMSYTSKQRAGGDHTAGMNINQSVSYRNSPLASAATSSAGTQQWLSLNRTNVPPLLLMPPEDMPQLHQAAWFNDLDTLVELLKSSSEPLDGLIWYNKKLYPSAPQSEASAGNGGAEEAVTVVARSSVSGGRYGSRAPSTAMSKMQLPRVASMETATSALKALLQRDYLMHACHPLTIAAANGNERIVDELLKAMLEDTQTSQVAHAMTWHVSPEGLPPGCPWITPLAAAALAGSGECIRLIAQAVARRKSLTEDRSTYGCFRFRPVIVAQTADAVQSLFKYGCSHGDTLRYSLCDAARRLAKREGTYTSISAQLQRHKAQKQTEQRSPQRLTKQHKLAPGDCSSATTGVDTSVDGEDTNSRGSPLETSREASYTTISSGFVEAADSLKPPVELQNGYGCGGEAVAGVPAILQSAASRPNKGSGSNSTAAGGGIISLKASELLLFRARLFHDSLGRSLACALCEFLPETLTALAALTAMVDQGLHPDRFLSHAEHGNITSTSLLMIIVRTYQTALRSAAGGSSGSGSGPSGSVAFTHSSMRGGMSLTASSAAAAAASSLSAASFAVPSDLSSALREAFHTLVAGLLAHGAVVDKPPRDGCRQVGGFHIAPPHGPEAPLHHAFIHGPQELVVLLLQYSTLHPEALEDLLGLSTPATAEERGRGTYHPDVQASTIRAFYERRPGWMHSQHQHRQHKQHQSQKMQEQALKGPSGRHKQDSVPWEGGRSSPLLAFGAKMQAALLEGNVPLWLHSGRFSELMEDLIKASIAVDARMVTCDLTWLVIELLERCMAHEFDNIGQLRMLERSKTSIEDKAKGDVGSAGGDVNSFPGCNRHSSDGAKLRGCGPSASPSGGPGLPALLPGSLQDTVITVDPVLPASPLSKTGSEGKTNEVATAAATAARLVQDGEPGNWIIQGLPGHRRMDPTATTQRSSTSGDGMSSDDLGGSELSSPSSSSLSSGSSDSHFDVTANDTASSCRNGNMPYSWLTTPEDSITLSIVHSLYRNTADAITSLHQELADGQLDSSLASVAAVGGTTGSVLGVGVGTASAALVDWTALLRLVARIAATTLNPPKSHGAAAGQISVFTTAKAVNQLLYARDWARSDSTAGGEGDDGTDGGGSSQIGPSVVDIDLLRAIARRHPHEAARLIHGIDLMRVELKGYRWDSIPMNLDQDFYAVLTTGEQVKLSNRPPTVAPASIAAAFAAEEEKRRAATVAAAAAAKALRKGRSKAKGATVAPEEGDALGINPSPPPPRPLPFLPAPAGQGLSVDEDHLSREDILQACIFSNMWTVLTHFMLSSVRLPSYMRSLQQLRNNAYKYAVLGQMTQYGSIPVVLGAGLMLALLGLLTRGMQRTVRLAGNMVLAGYGRLEDRLQPAMNMVGRRLQLDKVQRRVGRIFRRVDQLAIRATGGGVGVIGIGGSKALMTVRIIPHYLSFLGVLLDPDALAELWLGVTQHYSRGRAAKMGAEGEDGGVGGGRRGDEGAGRGGVGSGQGDEPAPAYMSWRTTRVVCSRVPLPCAAAMPSSLLYKLAASPQVNGEVFSSPVMRAVIVWRWQHFTRYFLLLQFVEHLIYLAFFILYAFSLSYSPQMFRTVLGESRTTVVQHENCKLAPSGFQKFLLVTLGIMTMTCVVQEVRQMMFFKLGWFRQPWNLMDFASSTIMGTIITLHLTCKTDAEWLRGLAAIEVALLFMRLLYFAMADDRLGSFFRMVIEVLRDCWLFFVFLGILFIGWGLALTVMQGHNATIQDTYLQLFTMIFGDFQMSLLRSADAGSKGLDHLWRMFASLYQILVTIILLNLVGGLNEALGTLAGCELRSGWGLRDTPSTVQIPRT
ncbi:hypothetical protein Vafri_1590 [Volvox africanus]|nr:hypothetical protein Vafri_1590 [Volvox africanus]